MENTNIRLEKENNDFFREWIIEEWKHHNTVDQIYQLRIIKPEELNFEENEEYYKIIFNNEMVGFIGIKNYEKEIYLYRFFIDEKYRNQGIGTIALNKVINICKLDEFINKSSFKLDTFISDLVVSGGEKDRIILARTIYKKANLYLLDEPLSEVGVKMEMQIFNELQDFLKDKKTIYISHKALDTKNVSVVNL